MVIRNSPIVWTLKSKLLKLKANYCRTRGVSSVHYYPMAWHVGNLKHSNHFCWMPAPSSVTAIASRSAVYVPWDALLITDRFLAWLVSLAPSLTAKLHCRRTAVSFNVLPRQDHRLLLWPVWLGCDNCLNNCWENVTCHTLSGCRCRASMQH